MKTARVAVAVIRAWLDVRFLRWARDQQHPYQIHHGERPAMPGYRRAQKRR